MKTAPDSPSPVPEHRPASPALHYIVADSGLGGLSIFADLVEGLRARGGPPRVALTFFNACPAPDRGYNRMADTAEKIRVFDRALEGMAALRPDLILIACNTLSVLYDRTPFARRSIVPVLDIIGFGVEAIGAWLTAHPDGRALVLGTPTTVEADTHRAALRAWGFATDRLAAQACDRLAGVIEKGPDAAAVKDLIERYVGEAASRFQDRRSPLAAALCCTHYGYSRPWFEAALRRHFAGPVTLLDPNHAMSEAALRRIPTAVGSASALTLDVLSRHALEQGRVTAIAGVLERRSPETAAALRCYRHRPDLFRDT